jgi:16S rRNA (cytosine1402-N4)-methyltransferase
MSQEEAMFQNQPLVMCMENVQHYPVMNKEIIEGLDIANRKLVLDCTLGLGALAAKCLEALRPDAVLVGIERDPRSLEIAGERLAVYGNRVKLVRENFVNLTEVLDRLGLGQPDAVIFDLGISTYQLSDCDRGFSFLHDSPLDMRMDPKAFLSAYDLVNNLSEEELANIFYRFGEERFSRRVAAFIVKKRQHEPISSTCELADIVSDALARRRSNFKIHPATRVFQALRIAVNNELEACRIGVGKAVQALAPQGRIAVVAFHSLEDRIVKNAFKEFKAAGRLEILTKKPLVPSQEEIRVNSASRSAKLRIGQRAGE